MIKKRSFKYFIEEWVIRLEYYWIMNKKIILINEGLIQFDDLSIIYRPGWWKTYDLENMMKFLDETK